MIFQDSVISQINHNRELFDFLKKIFPDAKAVPKYYLNNSRSGKPKLKASVIICPISECNYYCIEHQEPLADIFLRHLNKVHHIIPQAAFVENLKGIISYLRYNNKIPYIDPFIGVQKEHLF